MAQGDLATATPVIRVATPKPKFGIYFVMLIIALCALITSCVILYMFIRNFGGFGTVKGRIAANNRPAAIAVQEDMRLHAVRIIA